MKQISINDFFRYKQEPIYLVFLNLSYEEFQTKIKLEYEIWEEDGLGKLAGAAIESYEYKYFLKAAYDYVKPYTQISIYTEAGCPNPSGAIKNLIQEMNLKEEDIFETSDYFRKYQAQLVRTTAKDGDIVICNFIDNESANKALESAKKRSGHDLYVRNL